MNQKKVSIIIPAYNEEKGILKTLNTLINNIELINFEIIVVNDGSSDKTADILNKVSHVITISHPYNKGYGAALKTGIKAAKNEILIFYDGDGQHSPEDLYKLLNSFENYDLLIGKRGKDSYKEWHRRPGKWILAKVVNYLTGEKIPDFNSGLRVMKKSIISKMLHLFPDGFSFSTTSTIAFYNLGYNVGYYPIKAKKRIGKSSVKQFRDGTSIIMLILRLIILFKPLKIFIRVSVVFFLAGFIYEIIYGVFLHPHGPKLIQGALLLILSSFLIFFFGLVVDQISELRKHLNL